MLQDVRKLVSRPKGQRIRRDEIEARVAYFGKESLEFTAIMGACDLMRTVRKGGKRQNGEPWINHDRAVFIILFDYLGVRDPVILIAALIHDLAEDSDGQYVIEDVRGLFGLFGYEVSVIVDGMTKPDRALYLDLSDDEFAELTFEKVRRGGIKCRTVKYADRLHNMITLWGNKKKKIRKIRETIIWVLEMAAKDGILWPELLMATSFQTHKLRMQAKDIAGVLK